MSTASTLIAAETRGKLERWLWLPGNAAFLEPPCVTVRDPDVRPSGAGKRERAVNHAGLNAQRPQEGKVAPRGLQKPIFKIPH